MTRKYFPVSTTKTFVAIALMLAGTLAVAYSPLLCVAKVFKVGSGDLSLPGKVNQ